MQICERHRRFGIAQRAAGCPDQTAACLPVYGRTSGQIRPGRVNPESQVRERDREYIEEATGAAKVSRPDLDPNLFDFLRDLLLLRVSGDLEGELAMRFQQLTGPAMAKGVEDTTFYNYYRLVSLNEVGSSPGSSGSP
jgi:(1->4)-alpha-D-glucan 1-alpha-D-glucosylmutase